MIAAGFKLQPWKGKRDASGNPVIELIMCCGICGYPIGEAAAVAYGVGLRHDHCQEPSR